ncbi:MAG: protein-methionine-sulfoxide reductase catalytic subunit MsrP [Phycisphaerae bacterium]
MAGRNVATIWDVDRGYVTPESVYRSRREFLRSSGLVGLGAAAVLAGCRPASARTGDDALRDTLKPPDGSAFTPGRRNLRYTVQRPHTDELLAARYNNFYEFGTDKERCWRAAQKLTTRPWTVEIGGLVEKPRTVAIDDLIRKMPCEERLYRFRCVERWAMVVPWSGFAFRALMDWVQPRSSAKFVRFVSFHRPAEAVGQRPGSGYTWPYYEGLSIAEAANELCFVATGIYGHDLPRQHGAPLRMVVPWKYGYKGAKSVVRIEFVAEQPPTFWNDIRADEYDFVSNVDPRKPHPRWSQAYETMLGEDERRPTLPYNGYGEYVAGMYKS